jgi:hypothetical protein
MIGTKLIAIFKGTQNIKGVDGSLVGLIEIWGHSRYKFSTRAACGNIGAVAVYASVARAIFPSFNVSIGTADNSGGLIDVLTRSPSEK